MAGAIKWWYIPHVLVRRPDLPMDSWFKKQSRIHGYPSRVWVDRENDGEAFLLRTRNYKRLCPSVGPSVHRSVGPLVRQWARVEMWENERFRTFLSMRLCWQGGRVGRWVWTGDMVTPRHLFFITFTYSFFLFSFRSFLFLSFLLICIAYVDFYFSFFSDTCVKKRPFIIPRLELTNRWCGTSATPARQ